MQSVSSGKKTAFLHRISWIIIGLSTFSLASWTLDFLFRLFNVTSVHIYDMWPWGLAAVTHVAAILIGIGLMRRKPWSRIPSVTLLAAFAIGMIYLLVATSVEFLAVADGVSIVMFVTISTTITILVLRWNTKAIIFLLEEAGHELFVAQPIYAADPKRLHLSCMRKKIAALCGR